MPMIPPFAYQLEINNLKHNIQLNTEGADYSSRTEKEEKGLEIKRMDVFRELGGVSLATL
jgi:hypothetical protein